MPTRYSRISVVRDPALNSALETARDYLSASTDAGRLRELAIIGGRALAGSEVGEGPMGARAALLQMGATPESSDLVATSRRLLTRPDTETAHWQPRGENASESLEWVRGER